MLSRPFALAIAWQLLVEIARRLPDQNRIRVLEMHPGGGQYDLLTLWNGDPYNGNAQQIIALNLLGTAHKDSQDPRRYPWMGQCLCNESPGLVVNELAAFAGVKLLEKPRATSRELFGLRLIASLLAREALEPAPLDALMGFHDTSGDGGGVSDEVRTYLDPWIYNQTDAARWWELRRWPSNELSALVSVDCWLIPPTSPATRLDLFKSVQSSEDIGAAVSHCIRHIGERAEATMPEEASPYVGCEPTQNRTLRRKIAKYGDVEPQNGDSLINYQSEFASILHESLIPAFCSNPTKVLEPSSFKKPSSGLADVDVLDFLRAWKGGLLEHKGGGLYRAPRSAASEQFFWSGSKQAVPQTFSLWREPIITVAALARLHWDFGWPLSLIGTQSSDWAFDLVAFQPRAKREHIAGEVKKTVGEVDALIEHMRKFGAEPGSPLPQSGATRNAYKKVESLRARQAPIFWAVGPAGYSKVFRVEYRADGHLYLNALGIDALSFSVPSDR